MELGKIKIKGDKKNLKRKAMELAESSTGSTQARASSDTSDGFLQPPASKRAMLNPLVLAKVAKYLPAEDLQTLRKTSKLWHRSFVPEMQKKHRTVYVNTTAKRYIKNPIRMVPQNFTNLMRSTLDQIPFTKFHIGDTDTFHGPIFQDFFSVSGNSIRCLDLSPNQGMSPEANITKAREIIYELTPNLAELKLNGYNGHLRDLEWGRTPRVERSDKILPNLRRLELDSFFDIIGAYRNLMADLLRGAVNLASLSLDGLNLRDTNHLSILRDVRDLMPPLQLEKLKSLKIAELRDGDLQILIGLAQRRQNPLRLAEFTTAVRFEDVREPEFVPLFQTFLGTQAHTLKKFDFQVGGRRDYEHPRDQNSRVVILLPRMESLAVYHLRREAYPLGLVCSPGRQRCLLHYDGGTAGNNFPSLEHFEYKFFNYGILQRDIQTEDEICLDDMNRIASDGLTDLRLGVSFDRPGFGLSTTFATLFPGVTRLQIGLAVGLPRNTNSDYLEACEDIWTTWPGLVSLRLDILMRLEHDDVDQLLTGIRIRGIRMKSILTAVRKDIEKKKPLTMEKMHRLQAKYKTRPGLSDLKHLKQFIISVEVDTVWAYGITDIGGYLGLAMANPEMQLMEIEEKNAIYIVGEDEEDGEEVEPERNLITEECRKFIKSAFGPFAVINV